ncbi:hypothetical protein I3843_10G002100 [Carya illinoinensis]|uniref:pectinesterase n=1 Tax=Carya illinoinensis TaxID=32201 RepID=A0A922DSU7_CARIL|nr:hypothetical protein I3760_10G002300 [Carya illinoinensis]KAG6690196.1 hypothetical protein I3842_10G002200 [Carya illinoinensis]KAG7958095.1 hypothetical protein I3843_10G002100 [Carya illinoinensis]
MRIKTTFVWLSGAFAIALLSSFISTYGIPPSFTSIAKISSQLDGFNLAILNEVVKHGETMEDFLSGLTYMESRHHHRRKPKRKCNKKKWKSRLISIYKVALVLTVDLKGCANFRSVQKAVDAVPENSPARTLISIDSGTYGEKVVVNANKTNVIFQGQGYLNTAIEWNDTANSTGGTAHSFSVAIFAPNFTAYNISFKNTAPSPPQGTIGGQAVALRIAGDTAAFYGCGFYGAQDTLNDDRGRHYFRECFIQGSIDFIYGNARSLYESSLENINVWDEEQTTHIEPRMESNSTNLKQLPTWIFLILMETNGFSIIKRYHSFLILSIARKKKFFLIICERFLSLILYAIIYVHEKL